MLLVSPTIISSASQAGPLSPVLGRQSMNQELGNRSQGSLSSRKASRLNSEKAFPGIGSLQAQLDAAARRL